MEASNLGAALENRQRASAAEALADSACGWLRSSAHMNPVVQLDSRLMLVRLFEQTKRSADPCSDNAVWSSLSLFCSAVMAPARQLNIDVLRVVFEQTPAVKTPGMPTAGSLATFSLVCREVRTPLGRADGRSGTSRLRPSSFATLELRSHDMMATTSLA